MMVNWTYKNFTLLVTITITKSDKIFIFIIFIYIFKKTNLILKSIV